MKSIHYSCRGESHILADKVCQDCSYSAAGEDVSIAIVCDGHGGSRYFRSDIGAQIAVETTRECIENFVKGTDAQLFANKPFTQKEAATEVSEDTDKAFRWLFESIIRNWRAKIEEHAKATPVSEEERGKVEARYIADFEDNNELEKTYGCTLMCYVHTPLYWLAFHIGDGKCIAFDEEGRWSEPIPWDERCFLNKTTSLCDSSAIDKFRYCYCGDGSSPLAVFLGSDGIDDSFGESENMVNFYIQVLKLIAEKGDEEAAKAIEETLPQLSKIGSKDDMSVACVYDESRLSRSIKSLIAWQKGNVEAKISKADDRIASLHNKISELEKTLRSITKAEIDLQYAQQDLDKAIKEKRTLTDKRDIFAKELDEWL